MKKSIFCIIAVICCFQLFSQAKQTGNSAEPRKVTGIKKSQFVQQQVSLRERVSLDGEWSFATDTANAGEKAEWFLPSAAFPVMPLKGYSSNANGTILVPGIWDAQGYGTETAVLKHNFIGKGWYKKKFNVPSNWNGEKVYLVLTGISRYAKVWIDGLLIGPEAIGHVAAHQWEVGKFLAAGKLSTIVVCVDARQRTDIDAISGCAHAKFGWGGIWGHVYLEERTEVHLDELSVRPDITGSTCTAEAIVVNGDLEGRYDRLKLEIFDADNKSVAVSNGIVNQSAKTKVAVQAKIANAKLWSPDQPYLYKARLSLMKGNQQIDALESRFGMREIRMAGPDILLNGKRITLRGYGDDHIYPEEMAYPVDKNKHLKRLKLIKSYGFNYVRHHTCIMPQEYYDACDEIGMLVSGEFEVGGSIGGSLPGEPEWINNVKKGTSPDAALNLYKERWSAVIKQYRNHPSIIVWVIGNELWQKDYKIRRIFYDIAKSLDPDRPFNDNDGDWQDHILNPKNDRATLAFYTPQFDDFSSSIVNPELFKTEKPLRPIVAHEPGNYNTFSRPGQIELFQHNVKPHWLIPGKKKLEKLGLLNESEAWAKASDRLYLLHNKYHYESLRSNPFMSGYTWWLFQDYWGTSNGLVDAYFRPKAITPQEVLVFNNDVVLLQSGMGKTYRSGDQFNVTLSVSNFSGTPLSGKQSWTVAVGDKRIETKTQIVQTVNNGEVSKVEQLSVSLPEVNIPQQLVLSVRLNGSNKTYQNSWKVWLYPAKIKPQIADIPVYIDSASMKACPMWSFPVLPDNGKLSDKAVYIVSSVNDRIIQAMNRGASVILLDVSQIMNTIPVRFQQTWWGVGSSDIQNNTGTYIYNHPVTKEVSPEHYGDLGWFSLIEGADKYSLESFPVTPTIIVRALPGITRVENTALLSEVGVGKGTLILSGLNHKRSGNKPENGWILSKMIEHAATFTPPLQKWDHFMVPISKKSVPDGMVLGFSRIFDQRKFSIVWGPYKMDGGGHRDGGLSYGRSYKEENALRFMCRQDSPGKKIEWETDVIPEKTNQKKVTLIFAGGLGNVKDPKTDGFMLEMNGKELLKFDLPQPSEWKSEDGNAVLKFDVKTSDALGWYGVFTLTITGENLPAGKAIRLGVRSLGKGSNRWFSLNPYTNFE